jgi:hypothetical protein
MGALDPDTFACLRAELARLFPRVWGQPVSNGPFSFADFVRAGMPEALVPAALAALGRLLRSCMIARGVWHLPPRRWDYAGDSWRDPEAFDDLLCDCYAFVFAERRDSLAAFAARHDAAGVVARSVANFLNDHERRRDSAGHALFTSLRSAAEDAVSAGTLHPRPPDARAGNATVLAREPGLPAAQPADVAAAAAGHDPAPLARRSDQARRAAARLLAALADALGAFRLGDLSDALRRRLPVPEPLGEAETPARPEPPTGSPEDLDALDRRVRAAVIACGRQPRVVQRLLALWEFILRCLRETGEVPDQAACRAALRLPRSTVSDDWRFFAGLGGLFGDFPDD